MPDLPPAQVDEDASPFTNVTSISEPSFLPLYISAWRGLRVFPRTVVPLLSTFTVDVTAVQVVPEQAVQSGTVLTSSA